MNDNGSSYLPSTAFLRAFLADFAVDLSVSLASFAGSSVKSRPSSVCGVQVASLPARAFLFSSGKRTFLSENLERKGMGGYPR